MQINFYETLLCHKATTKSQIIIINYFSQALFLHLFRHLWVIQINILAPSLIPVLVISTSVILITTMRTIIPPTTSWLIPILISISGYFFWVLWIILNHKPLNCLLLFIQILFFMLVLNVWDNKVPCLELLFTVRNWTIIFIINFVVLKVVIQLIFELFFDVSLAVLD